MRKGFFRNLFTASDGSAAVLTALAIVPLVGMLSLAVDMGHLYTERNHLQNIADAAALAAVTQLVQTQNGVAARDSAAATTAALDVAQRQAQMDGMTELAAGDRSDVQIQFGEWNIYAATPETAWTSMGSSVPSNSTANAVQVTMRRAADTAYGPVTNFFAGIFGQSTSTVEASATAYLGYTKSVNIGTVTVPVALPDTVLTAARQEGKTGFLASLFGPKEAVAVSYTSATFKDLGGSTFYQNNQGKPLFDTSKAYMFIVSSGDSVPSTVVNNLKKNYTSGTPVRAMAIGTRIYPLSEYQWASNIKTIFQAFKNAYDAKKDASGRWRVAVPVYDTTQPVAQRIKDGFFRLARFFNLGPDQARACFTFWNQSYPGGNVPIYVTGFTEVDIVNVTYNANCDDCSPYAPAESNGQSYNNTVDCMIRNNLSCRNANSVTIEIPKDASTKIPGGSDTGGPNNQVITPGGSPTVGAFASIPKLVK